MAPGAERRSLPVRGDRDKAAAVGCAYGLSAGPGPLDEVGARRSRRASRRRIRGVSSRSPARSGLMPGMTGGGSPIGADTVLPGMGRRAGQPVQRAVVMVLAIVVVGWLAISYRDADSIDSGAYLAGRAGATPAQLADAVSDLRSAATLNPSMTDRLGVEAALEIRRGHPAAAAALLEELARHEPDARDAWFLLAQIYRTQDPRRAAEARAQFRRLDPREARKLHL